MSDLNERQFKKVIPGIGEAGEDLHTGLHYSDLKPGDRWIGLMGSTVKKVERGSRMGWNVHVSHPDHGDSVYHGRSLVPNIAVYRMPAGKKRGKAKTEPDGKNEGFGSGGYAWDK